MPSTKKPKTKAMLICGITAMLVGAALSLFATTAYAESSGSIAVYDSGGQTLRLYNAQTAANYVATSEQIVYSGFDSSLYTAENPAPWSEVRDKVKTIEVVDGGIQPKSTQHWFDGFVALESADIAKLDMSEAKSEKGAEAMFVGDTSLNRLTVSEGSDVSGSPDAIPEHAVHGAYGTAWMLVGGDGTHYTASELRELINSGHGAGTWVWAPLTADEEKRYPRVEERIYDPIDSAYKVQTDGHRNQDLTHKIVATLPSTIEDPDAYTTFQLQIEAALDGLASPAPEEIAVAIGEQGDEQDITGEVRTGGYGYVAVVGNKVVVHINDALSGFGKGIAISRKSVITVSYKAHLTDASRTGARGNTTTTKMWYSSPQNKTAAIAETTEATTTTTACTLRIEKVDRVARGAIQGAGLTVYSQSNGKFVQSDGSLSETPCEFTTASDGSVVIPCVGRGVYAIHETQRAEGHDAGGDATLIITPCPTRDNPSSVSASATGDGVSQPEDGHQVVGEAQDGVCLVEQESGTVAIRLSDPAIAPQIQAPLKASKQQGRLTSSGPTAYTIELLKVDKATKTPVALAGYKVATITGGTAHYIKQDGSLTTSPSEAAIFTTGDDGKVEIGGLGEGAYVFHEATHPNHYSTDAPDFTITITATRDSQTNELTSLAATYAGGFDDTRHKGAGYAVGHEDGILATSTTTGRIAVRSSMEYVLDMPRAGIDGNGTQKVLVALLVNHLATIGLFAMRQNTLRLRVPEGGARGDRG